MPKAAVSRCSGAASLLTLVALSLSSAPAIAQGLAVYARTPTGLPETLFDTDPAGAAEQLAKQCLDNGLSVTAQEEGVVTCRLPDEREAGARADLGAVGRIGRPIFYRFLAEDRDGTSRVLGSGWEEVTGFWGGTNERAFDDPVFHNALMDLMVKAGGRLPPGTRFPNHAMIGASFIARAQPEQSLEVTAVEPDSPAMRAGLQPGDLVTRIANRRTRTLEDLNRSLVEAAGTSRFEIRFLREGREGVALLRSEFRPAVTAPMPEDETVAAREEPADVTPVIAAPPPSAAVVPPPSFLVSGMPGMTGTPYPAPAMPPPAGMPLIYPVQQVYRPVPFAMPQAAPMPLPASSGAPAIAAPAPPASFSVADELAKFADLLKSGVITQAEFDAQKGRLLTR